MSEAPLFAERYEMDREIGAGGMARVFLALDLKYERRVAIKILRPELASGIGRERFLREIMIAARLSHPHILPLFDSGETEGMLYFVMPFVEGPSLRLRLMQEGRFPVPQALEILKAVGSAIDYAHRQGIVHRDIKPENIMTHDHVAMVADFGIGKALSNAGQDNLTRAGVVIGTPAYMSPEQIAGESDIDGRSDVYSLGCVLFELLSGSQPFDSTTPGGSFAARFAKPLPDITSFVDSVPQSVSAAIKRALAPDRADRFETAASFAEAASVISQPVTAEPAAVTGGRTGPSVAVLPFANLSADPENEYFSDGVTDEIINALMQLKQLHVAARTSSFAFKGKNKGISEVAAQLNVATVLEGSVRRSGSRVRITAQLISASDGYNLWSERYDREFDDVFAIQDEIAATIANRLNVALTTSQGDPTLKRPTDDMEAYQLYLKGRYLWNRRTEGGLKSSLDYFDQALERDPTFALAHAGKADSYLLLGSYDLLPRQESYELAKTEAKKALELDENLAEAHTSLGQALRADLDWAGEEQAYRRAIALNPNYATAHQWYGGLLGILGRYDEALEELRKAEELDPLSHAISNTVCTVLLQARRYEEALQQLHHTLELEPNFQSALFIGAYLYTKLGKIDQAKTELARLTALRSDDEEMEAYHAWLQAEIGDADGALERLNGVKATEVDPGLLGLVHAVLGDVDSAFEYLNRAFDTKAWGVLIALKGSPAADSLRGDPRFGELLRKMGLPED